MKKRVVTVETDYNRVLKIKTVYTDFEANELLASGMWTLLHGGVSHRDNMGFQASPTFILGQIEKC